MSEGITTQIIQVLYHGTLITYDEGAALWRFNLRNRDRSCQSLADAKKRIDEPVRMKSTFQRTEGWFIGTYDTEFQRGTATSVAERDRSYGHDQIWVSFGKKDRCKVYAESFYPDTPKNAALVKQIEGLVKAQEALAKKISRLKDCLHRIVIPTELKAD